jgi:hypothetical protein
MPAATAPQRDAPSQRADSQTSSAAATPSASETPRATSIDRPSRAIAPPVVQNGKGSQLVPLGSRAGAPAKRCAITMRA